MHLKPWGGAAAQHGSGRLLQDGKHLDQSANSIGRPLGGCGGKPPAVAAARRPKEPATLPAVSDPPAVKYRPAKILTFMQPQVP